MKPEIKKVNARTYKTIIKVCESEKETENNTYKVIIPDNPTKQLQTHLRKQGIL